jgi:outer membrane receptor protein involved in Fe transport
MTTKKLTLSLMAVSAVLGTTAFAEEVTLAPIVVSSDFRAKKLSQTSNSMTVIGEDKIYDKASQSFAEILGSTANVNFSAGGSKSKYIQIRGMGERGQFETPINPTVGLMIDGIDFSNATLGASLFDVKQIEVLRGPQGTTFGANALAGMVSVESNEPTKELEGHLEATAGNYNRRAFGAAIGGTLVEDTLLGRFSIYKNDSDGFITNSHLNRDDTNGLDELTAKAKLKWLISDNHTVDMTLMHINNDNGYDAFNRKNTRTTLSDTPGKDTQKTNAFSLKSNYQVNPDMHIESRMSYSKSDIEYSFDEDWTYTGEYYDAFDQYLRDKKQLDIDVRIVSDKEGKIFNDTTAWIFGAYYKKYNSDLTRNETYFNGVPFKSEYDAKSLAVYGQLDIEISNKIKLLTGVRLEKWDTDYSDSDNVTFNDSENLVGGKIGLEYQNTDTQFMYLTLSRGYKPSGFNPVTDASGLPKQYKSESLWNVDLGVNGTYLNGQLTNRTNLFYGKRKDQQVGVSYNNGIKFTDYVTNADKGTYYGLETEFMYRPNDEITFNASLGLLKAEFDTFYNPVDKVSKDGRTPAQSPKYQYNLGVNYVLNENWILKGNVEGRGSYYFSNTNDKKAAAYQLLHASIEYVSGNWSATIWGRNLANADYQTRGYYFGNFEYGVEELYTQQGNPRTFGFTLGYDF